MSVEDDDFVELALSEDEDEVDDDEAVEDDFSEEDLSEEDFSEDDFSEDDEVAAAVDLLSERLSVR